MLQIRNATINDIEVIRSLSFRIWPQTYSDILSQEQIDYMLELMYSKEALETQMREGHSFYLLYSDQEPVGFASVNELSAGVFKLQKIYVLPQEQGKGSGKFLLQAIVDKLKKVNAKVLQLNVNRNNRAQSFYKKLGFSIVKSEDIEIGKGFFMNDYVMEKNLNLPHNQPSV